MTAVLLIVAGAALVVSGVALLSIPAALIVAGVVVIGFGWDLGR